MSIKKTTQQFIEQAIAVHGSKYDYSLVDYIGAKIKVKIICPEHGVFKQNASSHLIGCACKKCSDTYKGETCRNSTEDFITLSIAVHGNKYDYSKVQYKTQNIKVIITCPIHGDFEQKPVKHIHDKQGCLQCSQYSRRSLNFIDDAINLHGGLYDYSLVDYLSCQEKVKIVCSEHGVFEQTPEKHLMGRGCPLCTSVSKGEKYIHNWLTKHNIKFISQYRFDGCVYIKPLMFDFYLPEYNTCIEYDGIQHFEPVKLFGGIDEFNNLQIRDKVKTDYCYSNKISLLRISYDQYKNIPNILSEVLI